MAAVSTLEGTTTFRRARFLMSDTRLAAAGDFFFAAFFLRPVHRQAPNQARITALVSWS
jgi:hypothetical protein